MINYVTLGTNDLAKSAEFYDQLLEEFGAKRVMANERMVFWMAEGGAGISICTPADEKKATVGNGSMVALAAENTEKVDSIYRKAIALGGQCEGKPGKRGEMSYAAYFRDLDGNKINAICYVQGLLLILGF